MNRAITTRFLQESLWPGLMACAGIVLFVVLFVWAMQIMGPQLMEFLSSVDFLRRMLELAFGISMEGSISSNVLFSIVWLHPVVLALAWGTLIAIATRQTSGEVERGTAELLLTLPLSRPAMLACGIICWTIAAIFISFSPFVGVFLGSTLFVPAEPVRLERFAIVMLNFLALNLAVAALATLAGCCITRRGIAVASMASLLVAGVAMNFLESFLPFIREIRFLNLLNYYRPSNVARDGICPLDDILVLLAIGLTGIGAAVAVWQRRDMPAP
jgi:ABC-type transport system involved in multi-copper enzyme maturation permease subunit